MEHDGHLAPELYGVVQIVGPEELCLADYALLDGWRDAAVALNVVDGVVGIGDALIQVVPHADDIGVGGIPLEESQQTASAIGVLARDGGLGDQVGHVSDSGTLADVYLVYCIDECYGVGIAGWQVALCKTGQW